MLSNLDSPLKFIAYAGGYAAGTCASSLGPTMSVKSGAAGLSSIRIASTFTK